MNAKLQQPTDEARARVLAWGTGPLLATPDCVLLGVLRCGAAYVPIDPAWPAERIAMVFADTDPVAVVVDAVTVGRPRPAGVPTLALADLMVAGDGVRLGPVGAHAPGRSAPAELAYIMFTSGSTGRPKGVCVEHRSVVDFVVHNAAAYGVTADSRVLAMASLGFDVSVAEIFTALGVGATLVVARDEDRETPDTIADLLRRERVTVVELPPALLSLPPESCGSPAPAWPAATSGHRS